MVRLWKEPSPQDVNRLIAEMDPISWALPVTGILSLALGFGLGFGLKPDGAAKALEAQAETLVALSDGQQEIVSIAQRPITIDAELRASLGQIPVQCLQEFGGSPNSATCAWATCLQFGQSTAQRPECRAVEAVMIKELEQKLEEWALMPGEIDPGN